MQGYSTLGSRSRDQRAPYGLAVAAKLRRRLAGSLGAVTSSTTAPRRAPSSNFQGLGQTSPRSRPESAPTPSPRPISRPTCPRKTPIPVQFRPSRSAGWRPPAGSVRLPVLWGYWELATRNARLIRITNSPDRTCTCWTSTPCTAHPDSYSPRRPSCPGPIPRGDQTLHASARRM